MNTEKEKELNKKLAEWAGFTDIRQGAERLVGITPDGKLLSGIVFTQSLDACFKWLVPKLWVCQYVLDEGIFHVWVVSRPSKEGKAPPRCSALDEFNPALALCLAISELIDGEKNG